MIAYDEDQLNRDLRIIVALRGSRKPYGFFTRGVYNDGYIEVVDTYVSEPTIYLDGIEVDKKNLSTLYGIGEHVINMIVDIEDRSNADRI
jgi:hypothetical protein